MARALLMRHVSRLIGAALWLAGPQFAGHLGCWFGLAGSKKPFALGHEFMGTVVEIGEQVTTLSRRRSRDYCLRDLVRHLQPMPCWPDRELRSSSEELDVRLRVMEWRRLRRHTR